MNLIARLNDHICFDCIHNLTLESIFENDCIVTYCSVFNCFKGKIIRGVKNEIVVSCKLKKKENEK